MTLFGEPAAEAVRAGAGRRDAAGRRGFVPGATVRDVVELARALYPHPLDTDRILDDGRPGRPREPARRPALRR